MTIAVIFSFLSNNPEMSFVTKDHFIWELLFSNRFLQEHYIYLNAKLDTDAIYTMLSLVAIIIISLY
jgi:membrane-bound acyltransferase YfiQ involved in biofilm formation